MNNELDYGSLGLRCGLEIHQQLLTEQKLFCRCPSRRYSDQVDAEVLRHMRPTMSELGEYDSAAIMEYKAKKQILYLLSRESVCTYEMDDTPPFPINQKAVDIALQMAMKFNCLLFDELHILRKQYLNGSFPAGFQRTMLLGVGGGLTLFGKNIGISQIALEEDSCREISDYGHFIEFRADRQGIPIIEVVTDPVLNTPDEVVHAAHEIALLMKNTGQVSHTEDSLRIDLNLSIKGGSRVEIQEVLDIQSLPMLVMMEAERQKNLLELRDTFVKRNLASDNLQTQVFELPIDKIYFRTKSLTQAQEKNERIVALKICGIAGLLSRVLQGDKSFAHEISGRIQQIACLDSSPNLYHTESMGEFGLFPLERTGVCAITASAKEDVVIILYGDSDDVQTAIEETIVRIKEATQGVPAETRRANPDGTSRFEGLLGGADRMYPDTDSPMEVITLDRIYSIAKRGQ